MAEFAPAVKLTLAHEGGFFHNQTTGEVVNRGITLATLRSLGILKSTGPPTATDISFVQTLTQDEAENIYHAQYWEPLKLDQITSQDIANKVFDLGVNMGVFSATRLLQKACGAFSDGIMGPLTIRKVNEAIPVAVLLLLRQLAAERYQQIAANDPKLAPNLPGWISRLNA